MRLTKPLRTVLAQIAAGEPVPMRIATLTAFSDLAAAELIRADRNVNRWLVTREGERVLEAERARLGAHF